MRHSRSMQAGKIMILGVVLAAIAGCGVDEPNRLTSNQRLTHVAYDANRAVVPIGTLTVEGSGNQVSIDVSGLPIVPQHTGNTAGYVYGAWFSYADTGSARAFRSGGRFRVAEASTNPDFPTGDIAFNIQRNGTLTVTHGGTALEHGDPLPDSLQYNETRFLITIEPDPDPDAAPGRTHLLIGKSDLPATGDVDLVVPVNEGLITVGDFSTIQGEALVNAATGEFELVLREMPYISRSDPPADPGIIYQAWFVDDDRPDHPRYQSIMRFDPNSVGDFRTTGVMNPGDGDSDGVPEPLDFERVVISIEPDALTAQQPVGRGADTSPDIFQVVPYLDPLPDVRD
jgi:hypothetical protein